MLSHKNVKLELEEILEFFEEVEVKDEKIPINLIKTLLSCVKIEDGTIYPVKNITKSLKKHIYSNGLCYTNLVLTYKDEFNEHTIQEDVLSNAEGLPLITLKGHKEKQYNCKLVDSTLVTPDVDLEVVTILVGTKALSYSNSTITRLLKPCGSILNILSQCTKEFTLRYNFGDGDMIADIKNNDVVISGVVNGQKVKLTTKEYAEFEKEMETIIDDVPIIINESLQKKVNIKK